MIIRDIPDGMIVWYKGEILGIKGATLPEEYYDRCCYKCSGNDFDYNMTDDIIDSYTLDPEEFDEILDRCMKEIFNNE